MSDKITDMNKDNQEKIGKVFGGFFQGHRVNPKTGRL